MDATTAAVAIVSILAAKGCAGLGLWLRHRYRTKVAAGVATDGGLLEWDEQLGDGHRLRVKLTHPPTPGGGPEA
ncbi:hypothetical protein QR77_24925 [Streptomyces sp. 150FB]|uniref:hypothetical protein n=1 Tax=Streptomyces sp. 150FB TaxID=1576605 RepID=UPI0005893837|nr:hypothetical protein [Streptomyces sp. 150FB]KIF76257.1 hypothetical protein QR77_24925 [Streptomyces sp. 150FB]